MCCTFAILRLECAYCGRAIISVGLVEVEQVVQA
jgi:hypothetical protein